MKLGNATYNGLKFIALVFLPALATAYFAIAHLWSIPHPDEVVGTITIVDTFLGALLHVSSKGYSPQVDGKLIVDKNDPHKDVYQFALMTPLSELDKLSHVLLKIEPGSSIEMKTTRP